MTRIIGTAVAIAMLAACSNEMTDDDYEAAALTNVKAYIDGQFVELETCATRLRDHAPATAAGWTTATVDTMKLDWKCVREHYERIEGAIAVLFPDFDVSVDQRYDGFLADLGPDSDPFDGTGVTGQHAIERILWADTIPANVVTFESALVGYEAARRPATDDEAMRFKTALCQRLVDDVHMERTIFAPQALDPAAAYRGVVGSLQEQIEKTNLAATGEDESRYAQHTLADMRANLAGGVETYAHFRAWVRSKDGGAELDTGIDAGFGRIRDAYAALGTGDALPPVPPMWNPHMPGADSTTPYGVLYLLLTRETDPTIEDTLVHDMEHAADLIGIPQLPD